MIRSLSYVLFVLSLVLVGPRVAYSLDADELPTAIENAKTAADHQALAEYYEGEAKEARATVDRHRRMAASYDKHRRPAGKGNPSALHQTMAPHCERVVTSSETAASEFEAMAAAHREMAKAIE